MGLFSAILGNAGTVSKEDLVKDFGKLLIEGEEIELGFKLIRDTFIFTSKRLILVDKQGITGSKTEYKSYDCGYRKCKSASNWRGKGSNWRSRDYGYHNDWYDGPQDDEEDCEEDWPGAKEYASFKKTRRGGSKKYFDNGSGLIDITPKSIDKKEDYYDSIIDKILDKNLSKSELEIVKDQYLDMNSVNDKTFYDYLLGNIID
jgi:hypothetical protein